MNQKSVLLVEDNPDDELLTLRAFEKNNIANQVVIARDGVEAITVLFGNEQEGLAPHPLPEFVLLDLNLPKISGLEVLKQLRANPRTHLLPVVVLTSSNEERDLVESYKLGANSYIRKPVDFDNFVDAVRQLGMYWLVLNQTAKKLHNGED